jgi:purine-binding chemotaxis protein CheW
MTTTEEIKKQRVTGGNKYLTFDLADELYGIDILKIREIIGALVITPIPQASEAVMGVINLRGRIIPVVDLKQRLGFSPVEQTERTCIIVIDLASGKGPIQVGVMVDSVSEVAQIPPSDIEPAPAMGEASGRGSIRGIAKLKNRVAMLLNIENILGSEVGLELADPAAE